MQIVQNFRIHRVTPRLRARDVSRSPRRYDYEVTPDAY
jgi:hypothetical protein